MANTIDPSQVDSFLNNISQIESGGGKYMNHKEVTTGLQKGQTAIGRYGLLPNTVDEIANGSSDPKIKSLLDMSGKEKKTALESNPDLERKVASTLAQKVLSNQGGDQEKAAYTWLNGHNLTPQQVEDRDYQNSDYVQKFKKLEGPMASNTPSKIQNLAGKGVVDTPLSIDNTPQASKIKQYLSGGPIVTPSTDDGMGVKSLYQQQQADLTNSISNPARLPAQVQPIVDDTPAQDAPMLSPVKVNATPPMSIGESIDKQSRIPGIMEVLNRIKGGQ